MFRRVNGRLGQLLFLLFAAATIAGSAAPRATWNRNLPVGGAAAPKPAAAEAEAAPAAKAAPAGRTHVVEKGENLYRIGLRYGVTADELASANGIDDPSQLEVGQRLVVPASSQVAAAPGRTASRPQVRPSVSRREPARAKREGAILRWPVQGVLYSRFGPRGATRHDGIDIAAPRGTKIEAAADGVVIYAGTQRGYGNIVIVRHGGDLITLYAHNERNLVAEGDEVKAGQPVSILGPTGRATWPHCHFEVRRGTEPHDPMNFLP
jgi:murein DD-endopeptidase MepM/ murein hydrolase activator NlpD